MFFIVRILLYTLSTVTQAYVVHVPTDNHTDLSIPGASTRVDGGEKDIYLILDFINEHLWFIIGAMLFVAILFGGYKVATEEKEGFKKTKTIIIGGGIGILVAIFSYLLVRIIVNLL